MIHLLESKSVYMRRQVEDIIKRVTFVLFIVSPFVGKGVVRSRQYIGSGLYIYAPIKCQISPTGRLLLTED